MKTTDKQLYVYRNILEYVDGEYIITNKISDKNIREMRLNMTDADAEEFDEFVARHWGEESVYRMEEERKAKTKIAAGATKRGRKPRLAEES
jgi:predicted transposase YbfD/YdcC